MQRMKKVMFFIESLAPGGAERALVNLLKSLDKGKYDLYVYTVTDEDIYQKEVTDLCHYRSFLNKKMYRNGGLSKLLFWVGIKFIYNAPVSLVYRLFIQGKYDVEVGFVEGFATKLVSSSTNPNSKKIAWVHTDTMKNEYADNSFYNLKEQIEAYNRLNKIITVSDTVKESFERKYRISENIEVIHNIINIDEIINKSTEKIDCSLNKSLQMVTAGRLEQQKGFIRLIEILGHIKGKDYSLWIIGDGSQKEEIKKRIEKYHLGENVRLFGFQENLYKYISKSDVFICSSYAEGYSTAISESIILGIPVFSVECSGVVEQLKEGMFGVIVPNTDTDLTRMLNELINNPLMITRYKQNIANNHTELQISDLEKIERLFDE